MGFSFGEPPYGGLGGFPPPNTALSTLLTSLLEADRKPRNRSEWEARFSVWQKPASETEEERIAAVANRIGRAMGHSRFLPSRSWTIVEQGSHHNNTNTRAESDIDLCMCLTDAFFIEGPPNDSPTNAEFGREPVPFTFDQYRSHVAWCLQQEFGHAAVTLGTKAIHLHKDDAERINADIVPSYVFQKFGARLAPYWLRGNPDIGVAFLTTTGKRITNFPIHHYNNGVAKNDRTGRRYKRVVRIIKRIRDHIADNFGAPESARACARSMASFLIESLVFNCPDPVFGHASIYDDVTAVLRHLSQGLIDTGNPLTLPTGMWWQEVNQIKSLFGPEQAWTVSSAAEFVILARSYMEI
jgi:hypothetical protein